MGAPSGKYIVGHRDSAARPFARSLDGGNRVATVFQGSGGVDPGLKSPSPGNTGWTGWTRRRESPAVLDSRLRRGRPEL